MALLAAAGLRCGLRSNRKKFAKKLKKLAAEQAAGGPPPAAAQKQQAKPAAAPAKEKKEKKEKKAAGSGSGAPLGVPARLAFLAAEHEQLCTDFDQLKEKVTAAAKRLQEAESIPAPAPSAKPKVRTW